MDIKNDYNLRENADIVALAMEASKSYDSTPLKEWFNKKYAPNTETRVFVVDSTYVRPHTNRFGVNSMTDSEFMEESKKQGYEFSLQEFQHGQNNVNFVLSPTDVIRFIQVSLS